MSPERITRNKVWTIKVAEISTQGHQVKEVRVDLDSQDPLSLFVKDALESIDARIEKLSVPISKIKGYGNRRPSREIKDIRKQRAQELGKLESAAELLRGKTGETIWFWREGDNFLGFDRWHQNNGTSEVASK